MEIIPMEIIPTKYKAFDGTIFDNEGDCLSYELHDCCEMFDEDEMPTKYLDDAFYVFFNNGQNIKKFNQIVASCGYETIDEKAISCEDKTMVYWDYETDTWVNFIDREKALIDATMFDEQGDETHSWGDAFYIILKNKQDDEDFIERCEENSDNYEYFDSNSTEENPNYLYYDADRDIWVNFNRELKGIEYLKKMFRMK